MNREQYLKRREDLLAQAQSCLDGGDMDGYNNAVNDIKNLDTLFEDHAKEQANLNAIAGNVHTVPMRSKTPVIPVANMRQRMRCTIQLSTEQLLCIILFPELRFRRNSEILHSKQKHQMLRRSFLQYGFRRSYRSLIITENS